MIQNFRNLEPTSKYTFSHRLINSSKEIAYENGNTSSDSSNSLKTKRKNNEKLLYMYYLMIELRAGAIIFHFPSLFKCDEKKWIFLRLIKLVGSCDAGIKHELKKQKLT